MGHKAGGDTGDNHGRSVSVLADGSVLVAGNFQVTATFGDNEFTRTATPGNGAHDVFVAKLSSTGVYEWVTTAGGSLSDSGYAISSLADGSAIVTGYLRHPPRSETTLTSVG